ncbi:MAG: PQQ-dependent sugar dehydrogenase, partial [Acidobacteriota bacterium]|nr:PQQ-dependent sugar dehydrogenase [Acidobacteriota bacterium]
MRVPLLVAVLISSVCYDALGQQGGADPRPPNATGQTPAFPGQTRAPERKSNVAFDVVTVAEGLQFPWGMA